MSCDHWRVIELSGKPSRWTTTDSFTLPSTTCQSRRTSYSDGTPFVAIEKLRATPAPVSGETPLLIESLRKSS